MAWNGVKIMERKMHRRLRINKDHVEMIEELTKHNQIYKGYVLDERREIDYYRIYLASGIIIETELCPVDNFPCEKWKLPKQSTTRNNSD